MEARKGHCPIWDCEVYAVKHPIQDGGRNWFVGLFFRPTLGVWSPGTRSNAWWEAARPAPLPEGVEVPDA